MSDFYIEQLIKVKNKLNLYGVLSLVIGIVIATGSFIMNLNIIFTLGGIFAFLFGILKILNSNMEYEYLFLGKEFDIDKILAKKKRRKCYSFHMDEVVVIAKLTAGEVKVYQNVKYKDFTSGRKLDGTYKVVLSRDKKMEGVLIEPTQELLEAMHAVGPRKVFI